MRQAERYAHYHIHPALGCTLTIFAIAGYNFQNRYLVVLYHQPEKMAKAQADLAERAENLEKLKREHGID